MTVLRDILVPLSLLRCPETFGGQRDADCLRGDLRLSGDRAVELTAAPPSDQPRVLLPALTEAHCHLDKCHSFGRIKAIGGDLAEAIAAQKGDKAHWTPEDVHRRMSRGLSEVAASGCRVMRSHIDWGDTTQAPVAWSVLRALAGDHPHLVVQGAALTGIDQLADRTFCFEVARAVAACVGGVLGAFVLHHDAGDIRAGLAHAFAAADHYGLALDFHVDEGLGEYNGLEAICDAALATGFQGPVLCGHAVSLIDRNGADLDRIIDKLQRTPISICALPTTNLYLQGRRAGTPDRRGLTRLREVHASGVPVVVGSDNVADAFCPMGQHDPRAALHLAALAAHLDPPMGEWLPTITLNAACALGLDAPFVEDVPLSDLRLCTAGSTADLVAGRSPLTPLNQHLKGLVP